MRDVVAVARLDAIRVPGGSRASLRTECNCQDRQHDVGELHRSTQRSGVEPSLNPVGVRAWLRVVKADLDPVKVY